MWHWRLLLVENNKFIWPPAWYTLLKKKKNNSQQKKNGPRVQRYPLMNGDIKAFTSLKNARANLHWGAKYPKMVSSDFFSFGCWFWARKFKFIIWNEFSSPLWRQNFIICLLRLAIVLQRWNFVKCTSNYLNFTKASSTLHSYTQLLEIPKYVSQRLFTSHCWKINTKSTYVNPKILAILARNFKF